MDGRIERLLVPMVWLSTGFLSWFLSIYLFLYLLSPLFIQIVRKINANDQTVILKSITNILFTNMADFMLCFLFAIILSYFSQNTKARLALFIFGALAAHIYTHVEVLVNYIKIYSEFPEWALTSVLQGYISLLLMVPLLSYLGGKIGSYYKGKKKSVWFNATVNEIRIYWERLRKISLHSRSYTGS